MSKKQEKQKRPRADLSFVQRFTMLPDDKKREFAYRVLHALKLNVNKLLKDAFLILTGKKNPTERESYIFKEIFLTFIFTLKPEYSYDWAEVIDKAVGRKPPKEYLEKLEANKRHVKSLRWFHIGLKPELWEKVNQKMNELGSVEAFFEKALEAMEQVEEKN